jgi:hypothetical protein
VAPKAGFNPLIKIEKAKHACRSTTTRGNPAAIDSHSPAVLYGGRVMPKPGVLNFNMTYFAGILLRELTNSQKKRN